jgi:hypothetical protein
VKKKFSALLKKRELQDGESQGALKIQEKVTTARKLRIYVMGASMGGTHGNANMEVWIRK